MSQELFDFKKCLYLYGIKSNCMSNLLNRIVPESTFTELDLMEAKVKADAKRQIFFKALSIILRIIVVAIGVILFFSGSKKKSQGEAEARRCWGCIIVKTHHTPTAGDVTTTGIDSICNKTAAELKVYNDTRLAEYTKSGIVAQISCQ